MQRIVAPSTDSMAVKFAAGAAVFCAVIMIGLAYTANLLG